MKRRTFCAGALCCYAVPLRAEERSALDQVNDLRRSQNRARLRWSPVLERAAQAHADDMARSGFFSHDGSDGSDIAARLNRLGYGWCAAAENIAKGQTSVAEVLKAWAGSAGHRRNMLSRDVTEMALARSHGDVWVMVLGRPGC